MVTIVDLEALIMEVKQDMISKGLDPYEVPFQKDSIGSYPVRSIDIHLNDYLGHNYLYIGVG
jgi:hypothetical protein